FVSRHDSTLSNAGNRALVNGDARTHGGRKGNASEVSAFRRGRLQPGNSHDHFRSIVPNLVGREGSTPDADVDDPGLTDVVVDLTGLYFFDRFTDVHRNSS